MPHRPLPSEFVAALDSLADAYLSQSDPIRQSGFGGGETRWRSEREPILDGIHRSGTLIDVGCANGHLLKCLAAWGHERGLSLYPCGVDHSPELIGLAQHRLPHWADRFFVGNAWNWTPPRTFNFVYSLYDNVPETFLADYVRRLLVDFTVPGARVIVGAYGSRTKKRPAMDIVEFLENAGVAVSGAIRTGDLPEARFAWIDTTTCWRTHEAAGKRL